MIVHRFLVLLVVALPSPGLLVTYADEVTTLKSAGAVGDGSTDDRAAIEAALVRANGTPVDGENATYMVQGNIELKCDVHLRNATLLQTKKGVDITQYIPSARGRGKLTVEPESALRRMVGELPLMLWSGVATYSDDPVLSDDELAAVLPSINLRTLAVSGTKERPVSVRLSNVRILRGKFPETGGANGGGIIVDHASPVVLHNVEVTGDGKGWGISITNSSKIELAELNIHDMNWAPYTGDTIWETPLTSIKEDFGWNNFPIYQFNAARKKFVRVRVQEQLTGLQVRDCRDVDLRDSKVSRLRTKIGDRLYALQADGVTVANVVNIRVRNCHFSEVWEGIDFTSRSGENFLYEDCTASDTFTFGFKLAHPKQNGKMVNCISYRAGNAGFVLEPEMENITFLRCQAIDTGANGFWTKDDGNRLMTIGGFRQSVSPNLPLPYRVKFEDCAAVNEAHPGAMDFGFHCEEGVDAVERGILALGCTAKGAKREGIRGIATK